MTDLDTQQQALPTVLTVTQAFTRRLPTQRLLDTLAHIEPVPFAQLAETQPFRLIAYRALLRDYPGRDETSLWLHAYDCEVDIVDTDPFLANGQELSPLSATTGT